MAGIEQLEIHSKSYIIRWVKVEEGHTISWSVQPHKKSINFGIVKHPGSGSTNLTTAHESGLAGDQGDGHAETKPGLFAKKDAGTAQAQLASKGFIPIKWHGKCEADKVSMGTYDVRAGHGGMFGLVFDNTFSKQTSKTATFVLLTYPSSAPPQTAHHLPNLQQTTSNNANSSKTSLGKHSSPRLTAAKSGSVDSLPSHGAPTPLHRPVTSRSGKSDGGAATPSANYHTGALLKRRRKKGQGYARRYFSLDYATCTLSYYHNRNSSALRGAIPLSLAAIAADERRREISIDSGAEIWHLKASNDKEFNDWARALERASRISRGLEDLKVPALDLLQLASSRSQQPQNTHEEADREWQQVEALVSRVVGTRDALRRLVKDLAAEKADRHPHNRSSFLSPATPAVSEDSDSYFHVAAPERRPFWRRKSTTSTLVSGSLSSQLAVPSPQAVQGANANANPKDVKRRSFQEERSVQDHCTSLLNDLDSVVVEFTTLLSTSKRRRMPVPQSAASRKSYESTSTEEFFDAAEGDPDRSQLLVIDNQSEGESPGSEADDGLIHDASSVSSVEDEDDFGHGHDGTSDLYPVKPKSLAPLPIAEAVVRRKSIPPSTVLPPSLIAFVRKNVGKDLSTISMPVSANEPTSLLQRVAEQLEYANLLDQAAKHKSWSDRLLYVAAFAISQFSGGRAKERAIRKPFNPLLGETFEMVRTEQEAPGGFRLLVEKVTHRPVRLAMQADSANWSFAQSPAPTQKFWGKSAELTTEGRVRITLRLPDGAEERYSWAVATVFLRNVVMGEKYVEPVGSMSVTNDSTGARAAVEFRSRGMFGGRGEDVQVEAYAPDGAHAGVSLTGTWTMSLSIVPAGSGNNKGGAGREIWRVGPLVDNPVATYGMTAFAAGLNEITPLEHGRLPPTDSRLRPDQRLAEEGRLEEAEAVKMALEEAQRARRRLLEERGEEHRPRWFVRTSAVGTSSSPNADNGGGEEVWRLKGGKDGYWEERARGGSSGWAGVDVIFGRE